MREILGEDLVPNTVYYIQIEINGMTGNGKQQGIFKKIEHNRPHYVRWYNFENVTDVVGISGFGVGRRSYKQKNTKFYLPENELIKYKLYSDVLDNIIKDCYCVDYYTNQFFPHTKLK